MVDYLAENSQIVVRFQGGSNAGHTVINHFGKFALHLLPSGVFYPGVTNVLGPGVALDIRAFAEEVGGLIKRGVPMPSIAVSDRAQVLLPYHRMFDEYEEERLGARQFGSTKSGIAPFYSDKFAKIGLQVSDLFEKDVLRARLNQALESKNVLLEYLYKKPRLSLETLALDLAEQAELIRPFVRNTRKLFDEALRSGQSILLEGQLGSLRDPDHGIYPYSTSSSTLAGYAAIGAGIPPHTITDVLAGRLTQVASARGRS